MTEYESYLRSWTPPPAGIPDWSRSTVRRPTTEWVREDDPPVMRPAQARQRLSDVFDGWKAQRLPPTRISGLSIEDEQ